MKIFCVRIGDKYGPQYEKYLEEKLPEYDFHWIRTPYDRRVQLQWNKMAIMNMDIDEPVCVMDIDVLLINNYREVFEYPIKRGQFLAMPGWWRDNDYHEFKINGGFQKYYPTDMKYVYDKFMQDPLHWQRYYIEEGYTTGPVNGEQYFVESSARENLEVDTLPEAWFCRMLSDKTYDEEPYYYTEWLAKKNQKYCDLTGNDFMFLDGEFHEDIKFAHFTHSLNKPHEWKYYSEFSS